MASLVDKIVLLTDNFYIFHSPLISHRVVVTWKKENEMALQGKGSIGESWGSSGHSPGLFIPRAVPLALFLTPLDASRIFQQQNVAQYW